MNNEIIFATEDTLIQPTGGLIVEDPQEQDHILGATGPDFEVLVADGHWAPHAPAPELQRNKYGDTFMCVSFSKNNVNEFLIKKMYGETVNFSDIFLGVGSGTVRGKGNSKRAVAEWQRLNGFVLESDYPYTPDMTLDQAYALLSNDLLTKGKKNLGLYDFLYKWLGSTTPKGLLGGLTFSPLQVDVSSAYRMNSAGYVVWNKNNPNYDHEVVLFDYEPGKCWWIFDSETAQYLKFEWNYPFGSPMLHALKKRVQMQIFKKIGNAALAVKHCSEPSMIAFSGGSVAGGDLFKSIYGIKDFKEIEITEVKEWPFPIRHTINTNPSR